METDPFSLANPESYDDIYRDNPKYMCSYSESPYYDIWMQSLSYIPDGSVVLDIGCGTGQYAKLLEEHANIQYIGIDFSPVAIRIAHSIAQGEFFCEEVLGHEWLKGDYDIIIMLEFLEHLENDLDFLESIPAGKKIIASVPNYLSSNHFRSFIARMEVMDHYSDMIHFQNIHDFKLTARNRIYLFNGTKL